MTFENGQVPAMCHRDQLEQWESFSLVNLGEWEGRLQVHGKVSVL